MNPIEPTYDRTCHCAVCQKSYKTKKLRSRYLKVLKYDTDFCPIYASDEVNPIFYNVNVCPHCGYSSTDDFSPYFPPGTIEYIHLHVCSKWNTHNNYCNERSIFDAIKAYKLAIYCGLIKKEKHIILAGLYLRLAWLYRILDDPIQEKRFINLAAGEYKESHFNDDYKRTQMSEIKLLYMIGELARRTDNINEAVKYFSNIIKRQNNTIETGIIEMTKERWSEIRAAHDK